MERNTRFLGACMGFGAQIQACERGPVELFPKIDLFFPQKQPNILATIQDFNFRFAHEVAHSFETGHFPVVIGGDHSIAIGTWNGVAKAKKNPLGLIWIDAHMDGHTNETTPSGAYHGMPLAALLGHGEKEIAQLLRPEPVLLPENVVLIGVRAYEEGEALLLEKLGVRIYFIEEVKERGLFRVVQEAIDRIKTPHLGLSIDLDAIDPEEAPGVGSPEANGLSSDELIKALSLFEERVEAFELVEYNPERDIKFKTREIAYKILDAVLTPHGVLA